MSKGKLLVVGSNATRLDVRGGEVTTGQYLNETVVPAMAVIRAGYEVVLATPSGAKPHIDERSDTPRHFGGDEAALEMARRFYTDDPSMNRVRTLSSVVEEGLGGYAALFVPGGHAPVADLMQDAALGAILRHFHAHEKPTALLCHAPVTLVASLTSARDFRKALVVDDSAEAARLARGWQYAGYRMTVYSASEEKVAEERVLHAKLHFNMVDALRAAGGKVITSAVDFTPHVIEDRELITGQNAVSDHLLGQALVRALEHRPAVSRFVTGRETAEAPTCP